MDFENMKYDCPWMDNSHPSRRCNATGDTCKEDSCAMFHWICELVGKLYISIKADIKVD